VWAESAGMDPIGTESVGMDPIGTESVGMDPIGTESAGVDPPATWHGVGRTHDASQRLYVERES